MEKKNETTTACVDGCDHNHEEVKFEPFHKPGTIIEMSDGTRYEVRPSGSWVKIQN